ncbi:hypothetical protein ACFYUL_20555 [Streptomyces sp. NPDC004311]|uniref:hypothetical protein n=1 Tax=Streptomyces sp. NPDC004311 TaxID=3364698 RepID=UPI0036AB47D7
MTAAEEEARFIRSYDDAPSAALRRAFGEARGVRVRIRDLAAMRLAAARLPLPDSGSPAPMPPLRPSATRFRHRSLRRPIAPRPADRPGANPVNRASPQQNTRIRKITITIEIEEG